MAHMSQNVNIRELSRRLERRVAAHGCGAASCDMCQDIEGAIAPAQPVTARPMPESAASARTARLPVVVDVGEAVARQNRAFAERPGD